MKSLNSFPGFCVQTLYELSKIFACSACAACCSKDAIFELSGTVGSVMSTGLSINGCLHSKIQLTRENKID